MGAARKLEPHHVRRDPRWPDPRGLSREGAATYVGVSIGTFDLMVADGRMPKPKPINRRLVWDRYALDLAFDALPLQGEIENNPWDSL